MQLTKDDFPLRAEGPLIYGRTRSSSILTAWDDELAMAVVMMLNNLEARRQALRDGGAVPLMDAMTVLDCPDDDLLGDVIHGLFGPGSGPHLGVFGTAKITAFPTFHTDPDGPVGPVIARYEGVTRIDFPTAIVRDGLVESRVPDYPAAMFPEGKL